MNHNAECKKHKKETCNTFETMVRKRKVENKQCEEGKKTNLQPNKKTYPTNNGKNNVYIC